LREMGLSTGRFTSPHLHNIRERIALNGNAIDADEDVYRLPCIVRLDANADVNVVAARECCPLGAGDIPNIDRGDAHGRSGPVLGCGFIVDCRKQAIAFEKKHLIVVNDVDR